MVSAIDNGESDSLAHQVVGNGMTRRLREDKQRELPMPVKHGSSQSLHSTERNPAQQTPKADEKCG
jgi:hypothetical protein